MSIHRESLRRALLRGTAGTALFISPLFGAAALAQTAPAPVAVDADADAATDIVVTGSRIDKAGFDAPTPTTVVGEAELQMGARPSIAQALNDLPQFRATQSPTSTVANTNSSSSAMDLRGLGVTRTLTLLNGRRFTGSADLNTIPQNMVKRVEVVTGGASAAWGSGAVGGVVNLILDNKLQGLTVGAQNGISSRGDGHRYSFNGSFGTSFAGGRGHFMIGGEYQRDEGIFDRFSRPNLGSTDLFSPVGGANGHNLVLSPDVFYANFGTNGLITSGPASLIGKTFNANGTVRPFQFGQVGLGGTTMVGGEGVSSNSEHTLTNPYQRYNSYARLSYDVGQATFWADATFSRIWAKYPFYAETGTYTLSGVNPFVQQALGGQVAPTGTIKVGRVFEDYGMRTFGFSRRNIEGAIGVDGTIGGGNWKYSAYYAHGELRNAQSYDNQITGANLTLALDAVYDAGGNIVCRDALTNPTTACRPLNILGAGRADPAAVRYVFGNQASVAYTTKLDTTGFSLRGDAFNTWAGPVSVAVGGEARWESITTNSLDPVSAAKGFSRFNFSPLNGGFNVQEGFGEVAIPLLDQPFSKLDINGAARYSHYSSSGGIWSWKVGATDRIFNNLLLRFSRSRDIRSASLTEMYTTVATSFSSVAENGQTYPVTRYAGGNPKLRPEIGSTLTVGAVFTPTAVPGLNLSVDYYNIEIRDAIVSLGAQDIVTSCSLGNANACAQIERAPAIPPATLGAPTVIHSTYINLAQYKTRGLDIEASYVLPMSRISNMPGSLRFRALATYVPKVEINNGVAVIQRAGDVGDNVNFGTPKWRGTGSITYTNSDFSIDARVRYVGGGVYDHTLDIANNKITSRTYLDLGGQTTVGGFTLFASVNNVFDRKAPLTTYGSIFYDSIGRYLNVGAKVHF
ncbi:TonB-dependent receptor [uncultured Sphingomonas sp.]|uniref:TonB-dependent receptor domain-containing protein n=1 Tax=uncultured Sphingomonas sp. TaxID=158754 RepID=UPI002611AC1F|nr:TonB-dependent receptor [uncultured Sphingomonas sp.]